jgi:hypothetical protein
MQNQPLRVWDLDAAAVLRDARQRLGAVSSMRRAIH